MENKQFTTWSDFKIAFTNKYSSNQVVVKKEAREKLGKTHCKKTKSFNDFIEEFQGLKVVADIRDKGFLVRYLSKALPEEFMKATKYYLNLNTD